MSHLQLTNKILATNLTLHNLFEDTYKGSISSGGLITSIESFKVELISIKNLLNMLNYTKNNELLCDDKINLLKQKTERCLMALDSCFQYTELNEIPTLSSINHLGNEIYELKAVVDKSDD